MSDLIQIDPDKYPPTAFSSFTAEKDFTPGNAIAMAWMSQLAYEATDLHDPQGRVAGIAAKWGWQAKVFARAVNNKLPPTSARGVIAVSPSAIVVAFTGTEPATPKDYITDIEAPLSVHDIHQGFETALEGAWEPEIEPAIAPAGGKALFLAGHSMGGALAVIAAARAVKEQINVTAVYTIGGARSGGAVFAGAYPLGNNTFRLVYGDDMVTALPPMEPLGYRHVGRVLYCPRGRTFAEVSLSPMGEDDRQFHPALLKPFGDPTRPYPLRSPPIELLYRGLPLGIADHVPDSYLNALGQTP
jgi:triacylglycerol lipase